MIEISTGVCHSAAQVLGELTQLRDALVRCADKLNIAVRRRRHAPVPAVARAAHLRQAALSRAVRAVRLPVQAVHHLRPARARGLPRRRRGAADAAPDVALHPALHRAVGVARPSCRGRTRSSIRRGSTRCSPSRCRAARRSPCRWDEFEAFFAKTTRTGVVQEHEGLLLGHPAQARVRHDRDPRVRHAADGGARRGAGRLRAVAGAPGSCTSSRSCRRRTTTWSTRTTASRPAASGWRRCTWSRPPDGTCRCATTSLATLRQLAPHARGAGRRPPPSTLLARDAEQGANDARWLRERQARERLLAEVVRQGTLRFRGRQ